MLSAGIDFPIGWISVAAKVMGGKAAIRQKISASTVFEFMPLLKQLSRTNAIWSHNLLRACDPINGKWLEGAVNCPAYGVGWRAAPSASHALFLFSHNNGKSEFCHLAFRKCPLVLVQKFHCGVEGW